MKKLESKLTLNRETLRHLDARELTWIQGGLVYVTEKGCQTDSCQTCVATHCNPDPPSTTPATQ